jgi:hypothetical protein
MKTFKSFLQEARAEGSPKQVFESIDLFQISQYCPDLFWMLKEDALFYRGMKSGLGLSYVDLTKTKRKSENTSNFYTEIFDNHPKMRDFPKRGESLICTTDFRTANSFGDQVYMVLPVKSAKIGEVGEFDIWDKMVDLFGFEEPIAAMNDYLSDFIETGLGANIKPGDKLFELLKQFDEQIRDENSAAFKRIQNSDYSDLLYNDDFCNAFLETILDSYSPAELHLKASTPATFSRLGDPQEVWFDTGAIIIPINIWEQMKHALLIDPSINTWEKLFKHWGMK